MNGGHDFMVNFKSDIELCSRFSKRVCDWWCERDIYQENSIKDYGQVMDWLIGAASVWYSIEMDEIGEELRWLTNILSILEENE